MKGALNAPDGRRPHPPRTGETEGTSLKGRDREILFKGMKGWRPSAPKARAGSGFFKRTHFCRTSDRSACLFPKFSIPVLMTRGFVNTRFPFSCSEAPRPASRTARVPTRLTKTPSAILKRRQPFTCPGGPRNEDEKERHRGEQQALPLPDRRL